MTIKLRNFILLSLEIPVPYRVNGEMLSETKLGPLAYIAQVLLVLPG
jgi:hypothetical protein